VPSPAATMSSFVPGVSAPAEVSAHPHWFVVRQNGLLVRAEGSAVALPTRAELERLPLELAGAHYLGRLDGEDCFVVDADAAQLPAGWPAQLPAQLPAEWELRGLRVLYAELREELFAVAGRALQIATFAGTHRYCGRCAQPTVRDAVERCVRCPACELVSYPRVSPAIIVLVRRGNDALLARSSRFATGFYSTLAGFVEPGESLEQTLEREVFEEVGIRVNNIRYFGSQPWPFPHSLMIGYFADYAGGEIVVDGKEILDAHWFSSDGLPPVPPKLSIARRLIDTWVEDVARGR
jgi:NAD+ diphosphatase